MAARVDSEVGALLGCVLCAPGPEHDAMGPSHIEPLRLGPYGWEPNPDYLLFDDLVLLPQLQAEHAVLRRLVAAFAGEDRTWDLRGMIADVLADRAVRDAVVAEVLDLEGQLGAPAPRMAMARALFADLPPAALAEALLAGRASDRAPPLLAAPAPNLLFARDLWAVVGEAIVLGWPRARARKRDGVLARAVARHHPACAGANIIDVRDELPGLGRTELDDERCIEGGDIVVLDRDLVLIGIGERTTQGAARAAALRLREVIGARHVLGVILPVARATMHLDTVLTAVDRDLLLAHPIALGAGEHTEGAAVIDLVASGCPAEAPLPIALAERGWFGEIALCGDGDPHLAAREQWSDGANALCLVPGGVVLYGRNRATLRALNRKGCEVLDPSYVVANAELLRARGRRFAVALPGSELSRGRGGPRCLTLPLLRGAVRSEDAVAPT